MRILLLFGGLLGASRGTPSRARNLASALAAKDGIELLALSRECELKLPGVEHRSLEQTTLEQAVADFRPQLVYGQTHKALPALAALRGTLRVVDLHGDPVAEKLEERWRPLHRRLRSAFAVWRRTRIRRRGLDGLTVVSHTLERAVEPLGLPVQLVWGGVDPGLFSPTTITTPGDKLTIGYAGNFQPYQGLPTLLEAVGSLVARGRDLELILVGDPGATGVDRLARQLLGERVTLAGQVAYEAVPEALARANVLVIPRPDSRPARAGFPSKLPEYMALGKALVITDVGDQGRVVRDGESGLVVPPSSSSALAAALERLRDEPLRDRLGQTARAVAQDELSWRAATDSLLDFFVRLQNQP